MSNALRVAAATSPGRAHAARNQHSEDPHNLCLLPDHTLVAAVSDGAGSAPNSAFSMLAAYTAVNAAAQVGDGATIVLTRQGYKMLTIPQRGEYANETYFVTNPTYQDLIFRNQGTDILALAMFTDGIQNLAIDLPNKRPNDACISQALTIWNHPNPTKRSPNGSAPLKWRSTPRTTPPSSSPAGNHMPERKGEHTGRIIRHRRRKLEWAVGERLGAGNARDTMELNPYIRLAIEQAAFAGRMTHHHNQVKELPYPEKRAAHAAAADQLSLQFQASLGLLRDTQPDQANPAHRVALELATENARTTASTYQNITALKRQFLPVVVSEDMDESAAAMMHAEVAEFRNLDVPINFHIIASPSLDGSIEHEVVITYLGPDAIHIAFAGDDYPPDTPAETAFEHYQYMSQWTNYPAAQPSSPQREQTLAAARKAAATTYVRFQAGLHAALMDEVLDIINEALSIGIEPQTVRRFITGLCDNQPNFIQGLMHATGLDKLANDEQAAAIISAAELSRVPQATINALIEFLGHDPARLGQPQTITSQEHLAQLAKRMMAARVPGNNAVQALTQAGLSDQVAYRIAEQAGYQVFTMDQKETLPPRCSSIAKTGAFA